MLKSNSLLLLIILLLGISACQVSIPTGVPKSTSTSQNSVSQELTPQPSLTPYSKPSVCNEESGTFARIGIPSDLLSSPMDVNIYLPPCYDSNRVETYPVLYMLHGQAATNDQWFDLGLTEKADQLINAKVIQPLIIVMPYEISWHTMPEDSNYGTALIEEAIPFIEDHFRVCTTSSCRAIGGLSRGGNWAVYLGFQHPDFFSAVGAHSAPLFYGELGRIDIAVTHTTPVDELPALYIDMGIKDEDKNSIQEFVNFLKDMGIAYEFHENEGRHEAAYWSAHVTDYLLWYSKQLTNTAPDA